MPGVMRKANACGCTQETFMGQSREKLCEHGNLFEKPGTGSQRPRDVASSADGTNSKPKTWSTLKRGKGFAASPAQRAKVKDQACIVCTKDRFETEIHPAHVYPRRLQPCECAEGVVALCSEHHRLYDDQNQPFDLLPYLTDRGCHVEFVHAIAAHQVPFGILLEQVTGAKWVAYVPDEDGAVVL